jgi:hypothetical protein
MARKTTSSTVPATPVKRAAKPRTKTKPAVAKPKRAGKKLAYTPQDIALRAYFISEKRRAHGLSGNEHQDWVEAERQLAAESKRPKKAKKV